MSSPLTYFLPYQRDWINDNSALKLMQKSRQLGISYADAYHSVRLASAKTNRLDVYISSRDHFQAKLYIEDCKHWAEVLHQVIFDLREILLAPDRKSSAFVIQFANGRRIHSLSSNPNALAGKRGHVKLDEFALHQNQRLLYRVAKPVTTWGGTLSVISTHRGSGSVFNQLVRDIVERSNPMGWSFHTVPLSKAVEQGLVETISRKTGHPESRSHFMARIRSECIDEEQWLQEYCCVPADENSAFIPYELLTECTEPGLAMQTVDELAEAAAAGKPGPELYLGMDVARRHDLCVLDVGEKIGDVVWDRVRLEMAGRSFAEIEEELFRLLQLKAVKRACIDATGMGVQLAERAQERFEWKVEPVVFTSRVKEELATGLKMDLEKRQLRLADDAALRADLRGIRKEVTRAGNSRYAGEAEDSHCDRFWAKALRQHAARHKTPGGGRVG